MTAHRFAPLARLALTALTALTAPIALTAPGTARAASASAAAPAAAAAPALAPDRTELERTPIVGNRELPKVLYIVPWKKPAAPPLARPAGHGVLDDALAPVDRDVLRRQLRLEPKTPNPTPPNASGARP